MRAARTATLLTIALLALVGAGCGGSSVSYEEVPGPPATVPIPDDQSSLEGGSDSGSDDSADSSDDASADETPTPTPDAGGTAPDTQSGAAAPDTSTGTDTGGTDTGTGTTDDGGGTAAPDQDSPTADATPEPGSDAQQFEDFCSQNPGAC